MTESSVQAKRGAQLRPASTAFESKADYIARELRRQIFDGTLSPDTELRQRDLAAKFNVSPTPVREALSRLHAEGYITTRLHHGATVVRSVGERRQENWRIRASLESLATELAAERATADDFDEIETLAERFRAAVEGSEDARTANVDFHFRIYEAAGSPVLLRFIEDLWRALDVAPNAFRRHERSAEQHFAILEALRARDSQRAAELTREHISETAARQDQAATE